MAHQKWVKMTFIFSLVLNVALIIGFGFFKHYVRKTIFQLEVLTAQAEVKTLESIISELDSNDVAKIENLKKRLQERVETTKKVAAVWKDTAEK